MIRIGAFDLSSEVLVYRHLGIIQAAGSLSKRLWDEKCPTVESIAHERLIRPVSQVPTALFQIRLDNSINLRDGSLFCRFLDEGASGVNVVIDAHHNDAF